MPAGKRPEVYGTNDKAVPVGFVGQTVYPFRKPIPAIIGLAAAVALGVFGWKLANKPVAPQEEQRELAKASEPPELLRLTRRDSKAASAVVANAVGSRMIYGSSDGTVTIRDVVSDRETQAESHAARVNALAISPNGAFGISASGDGTVKVFNAETGAPLRTLSHDGKNVMGAAVSDDGWVATGSVDGSIRLWNSQGEPAKQRTLEPGSINALAVCDGGTRVVAAQNSDVSVWDVASDTVKKCEGLKNLAYCVGIGKDGKRIAAGEYDGRLHLWDAGLAKAHTVLPAHTGPIYSVAVSPDGDSIVTGGADKIVRVWNAQSGLLRKELDGHPGLVFSVSYDAGRDRVLAAGKDLALTGWNVRNEGVVPAEAKQWD